MTQAYLSKAVTITLCLGVAAGCASLLSEEEQVKVEESFTDARVFMEARLARADCLKHEDYCARLERIIARLDQAEAYLPPQPVEPMAAGN